MKQIGKRKKKKKRIKATVAVSEWIIWALINLFVKYIFKTYGFRNWNNLGGLIG